MTAGGRRGAAAAGFAGALATVALLACWGLGRDGLWDPMELDRAEEARVLAGLAEPGAADDDQVDERRSPGQGDSEGVDGDDAPAQSSADPLPADAPHWIATGFGILGLQGASGRLPLALAGVLVALLAGGLAWRFAGPGHGTPALAVLVAGTSPGFLMNARTLLGDTPGMLAQGIVGVAVAAVVLEPPGVAGARGRRQDPLARGAAARAGLLGLAVVAAAVIGGATRGVLLGVAPPLVAGALVVVFRWSARRPAAVPDVPTALLRTTLVVAGGLVAWRTVAAVIADHASGSVWVGAVPRGLEPPTFEAAIERVFHGLGPWSALLVPALGALVAGPPGRAADGTAGDTPDQAPGAGDGAVQESVSLRAFLLLWIALTYAAVTVFTARYGATTPLLAVVPMAIAVALLLRDVADSERGWPLGAVLVGMLVFLLWRDLRLYPERALALLPISDPEVPEGYNPRRAWTAVLAATGAVFVATLGIGPAAGIDDGGPGTSSSGLRHRLAAPYRLVRRQWGRNLGTKAWLVVAGALLLGALGFGGVCWLGSESLPITTLGRRVGRGLLVGVVAIPFAIAGGQLALAGLRRLGRYRLVPTAVAGAALGAWTVFGLLPELGDRLSPRSLYRSVEALAPADEPLAIAGLGRQGALYYLDRPVSHLDGVGNLRGFLFEDLPPRGEAPGPAPGERRWAVMSPDSFPGLDRGFRRRTGRHLFVADEIPGTALLVATHPVPGVEDRNPIARFIRKDVPPVTHPVGAVLGDAVELVGYDLELPRDRPYVGAGEEFTIRWIWKARRRVPGGYKVFVHIDGAGQRIHGDHEPVDGMVPVRLWEPGDVVVDEQTIAVPASHRPGRLTIWVGLYAGERRLEVVEGPEDGADRVRAGELVVR